MLEETNAPGVAQSDYIYLNGMPIAVLNNASETVYFLHDDRLGTPQLATDSEQNPQWQASYEPFGQTTSLSGTITQNLRLPGQYFDVENGWNHNSFRDYMPELGRYLEPDPLGMLGSGNNLFVYVGDNPVNLVDPLGLCALPPVPTSPNPILKYAQCRSEAQNRAKKATVVLTVVGGVGLGDAGAACLFTIETGPGFLACEGTVLGLEVLYEVVSETSIHVNEYQEETQCMEQ
ncbi:MAG: RHS repeat-associated core domain-containing protein [Terracidiphilus sp.]